MVQMTNKIWRWTTKPVVRKLFNVSRWLHIYLSTTLFSLLIFFCVTGLTLNHLDWLGDSRQQQQQFSLATPATLDDVDTRPLLQLLHQQLGLNHASKIQIDLDMAEVTVDFSLPAGYAFAVWDLQQGKVDVDYQNGSLMSLFNDLHKGRHAGTQWGWLIDLTAVGILLFAFTGLIILMQQVTRRNGGLILVLVGTMTPWLVYLLFVPRIH